MKKIEALGGLNPRAKKQLAPLLSGIGQRKTQREWIKTIIYIKRAKRARAKRARAKRVPHFLYLLYLPHLPEKFNMLIFSFSQ